MNETRKKPIRRLDEALDALFDAWAPESLLHVGIPPAPRLPVTHTRPWPAVGPDWLARTLANLGRFEAVLVDLRGCPASPDEQGGLLGRVRDLHTGRVATLAPLAPGAHVIEAARLRALGFRPAPAVADGALFYYELARYKTTPDWFGPTGWANPERWNLERW